MESVRYELLELELLSGEDSCRQMMLVCIDIVDIVRSYSINYHVERTLLTTYAQTNNYFLEIYFRSGHSRDYSSRDCNVADR